MSFQRPLKNAACSACLVPWLLSLLAAATLEQHCCVCVDCIPLRCYCEQVTSACDRFDLTSYLGEGSEHNVGPEIVSLYPLAFRKSLSRKTMELQIKTRREDGCLLGCCSV
jgi:hypothetical protein